MKRKSHKKSILSEPQDLSIPIDITKLGTDNDPCFGKHYDARASECIRCGDCELCLIKMGQRNHGLRKKEESKKKFKDLEEKAIYEKNESISKKEKRKKIKERINLAVERNGEITESALLNDVYTILMKYGITQVEIKKVMKKIVDPENPKASKNITFTKNKYTWKK